MDWILLIAGIFLLLLMIRGIAFLEKKKDKSLLNEIKQNFFMLPLGVFLLVLIVFIPSRVWILFGSPPGWETLYIFGISGVIIIALSFWFYSYRIKIERV